jgi:hypothetical protein
MSEKKVFLIIGKYELDRRRLAYKVEGKVTEDIISDRELRKMLNKSKGGARLMWLLGPDLEKKVEELENRDIQEMRSIYEKVSLYSLLLELLNIAKKLHVIYGNVGIKLGCLYKALIRLWLYDMVGEETMKKIEEKIKKGKVDFSDQKEILVALTHAEEESILKLTYALKRLLSNIKTTRLSSNKVKEILDAIEEIDRVLEQVKEETRGNKDLEEREECFSEN